MYICVMCIRKYECMHCIILYFVATCKRPFGPLLLNKMNKRFARVIERLAVDVLGLYLCTHAFLFIF